MRQSAIFAPAGLPKEGTGHDLAIATAILVASNQLDGSGLARTALIGELALDGSLRPVPGAMALVAAAAGAGIAQAIVPAENAAESAMVGGVTIRPAARLGQVVRHLAGVETLRAHRANPQRADPDAPIDAPDLVSVIGQRVARRALEIAVAGRHNLALTGPPGVGKTLLARAAAALLPPLTEVEAAEVSRIHSVAGVADARATTSLRRPFRVPHHTISTQALVGGGPRIRPGEASLAHRGALLLDEALQFRSDALDALRGPIDAGIVTIARVDGVVALPARFMLLATYNPCPCGWFGITGRDCNCEDGVRRRYQARLSGPMRDRLDLVVPLESATSGHGAPGAAEASARVAERIAAADAVQRRRAGAPNAELSPDRISRSAGFGPDALATLEARGRQLGLSLRRLHRAGRVARTIADLDGRDAVSTQDVDEAIAFRPKELAS